MMIKNCLMLVVKKIFNIWFSLNEKLRFILVGGYNSVFSYGVFFTLNHLLQNSLHYLFILTITHLISISNSFFNFRFFVFQSRGNVAKEYAKVFTVYLGYFACNSIMLFILKELLNINILLAQLICMITLAIATYFVHKKFSFKASQ